MNSLITITPTTNIKEYAVVDNNLVTQEKHDSYKTPFIFLNIKTGKQRAGTLIGVSLYDDVIVRDDVQYKILRMRSL